MNFTRLFVYLPYAKCADSTIIQIDEGDRVNVLFSPPKEAPNTNKAKLSDQKLLTEQKIKEMLKNWNPFIQLEQIEKDYIFKSIENISTSHSNITVGLIRAIYHSVISLGRSDFEKVGCARPKHQKYMKFWSREIPTRVVLEQNHRPILVNQSRYWPDCKTSKQDKAKMLELSKKDNADAIIAYREHLYQEWGKARVNRVLECTGINFDRMIEKGILLLTKHIKQIRVGLNDVHQVDIEETYKTIKQAIDQTKANLLEELPANIKQKLFKAEGCANTTELIDKLKARFVGLPNSFSELENEETINYFIQLLAQTYDELETSLLGSRLEGVMMGAYPGNNLQTYLYSKGLEDKERAQVYQEIYEMKGPFEDWQNSYVELLCKFLIKKEICRHEDRHDVRSGMLIPAPNGEWYRIDDKFSQDGKHALFLTPLSKNKKRPSMIIYMSTASSPSHTHAPETIAHDATPQAPGLYGKNLDDATVKKFFEKSENPIIIAGHSLGGTFAQYRVLDTLGVYIEKENWELVPPRCDFMMKHPRPIKMICFDPPAVREEDAVAFAEWAKEYQEFSALVSLEYFISESDIVPGGGKYHIGYGCEDTNVRISFNLLDNEKNATEPELAFNPHGRFYLRSKKVLNQTKWKIGKGAELNKFDQAKWRRNVEIFRLFLAIILLPLTLLYLSCKWAGRSIVNWWKNRKVKHETAEPTVGQLAIERLAT